MHISLQFPIFPYSNPEKQVLFGGLKVWARNCETKENLGSASDGDLRQAAAEQTEPGLVQILLMYSNICQHLLYATPSRWAGGPPAGGLPAPSPSSHSLHDLR